MVVAAAEKVVLDVFDSTWAVRAVSTVDFLDAVQVVIQRDVICV
jgi:hypothetical protein